MLIPQKRRRAGGQHARTDPSRKVHTQQSRAPAGPGRNRTTSGQGSELAAAAEATEQPADTSGDSATNDEPPRTAHRTGRP